MESHPCNHIDIFEFAAALLLNSAVTILRYAEVVAFVEDGDPGARYVVRREAGEDGTRGHRRQPRAPLGWTFQNMAWR